MSIDPYTICPGGCNKKIKFCCGKDVSVHLDKIITALTGEQRLSALDMCNAALKQFGNKPCLLAVKTNVQFQLSEWEGARETLNVFLAEHPENSVALAMDTISRLTTAQDHELDAIVEQLQRCLENIEEVGVSVVLEAVRRAGIALYSAGRLPAARAHLTLYNGLIEEGDQEIAQLIMRTFSSPEIPLLLRHDHPVVRCQEETEWADEFNNIIEATKMGRWLSTIEELTDLDKKYPNQPLIAKTIAILESRLGEPDEMAAAWSQFADTDGVPLDEAVEAEALSQLIDPTIDETGLDVVDTAYPIKDISKLLEVMAERKLIEHLSIDLKRLGGEGPPPKGAYLLLDREMPASHENLSADEIPEVIAQMLVYGKQTDRDARLNVIMTRDDEFDANEKQLQDSLGAYLNFDDKAEQVVDQVSRVSHALTWNWRFPDSTPPEVRQQLIEERRKVVLHTIWPDLPMDELDGKTPREASGLDNYKIPVLGAILLLELTESSGAGELPDLNPLRSDLGLPTRDLIDPTQLDDVLSLSLVQTQKLQVEKLEDDQLVAIFHQVGLCGVDQALKAVCEEMLTREALLAREEIDLPRVYAILSRLEDDDGKAFDFIHKARDLTIDAGQPVGTMLVAELELRLERGVVDQIGPLLKEIETRHMREPGVSQNLMRVLMRFGIIGPDGKPRGGAPDQMQPEMETAVAPAESGSALWTPDGGDPPGGGESKLWVPGDGR